MGSVICKGIVMKQSLVQLECKTKKFMIYNKKKVSMWCDHSSIGEIIFKNSDRAFHILFTLYQLRVHV